ncbi:hypothetical protein Taro_016074 [Colocasia esculenta]|uniref:Uncharacterized protein n=1 Tax=Colocasia esculenta TaxID=4460 RepID=A0A843UD05_COLES|nr:hypothetical protein [Colocasia esculenta]
MKRIETSLTVKTEMHFNTREEIFRCVLTLHILLECPPGDFPDNIREDIVNSFIEIFSQVREEGKISRKLMECMNTYLLKDGPNLGSKAMEIHRCLHDFVFRYWLTTHDRGLKNTFILYAKMQLKLIRRTEGAPLIEQLFDVIGKELDQAVGSVGTPWSEATRDDKIGPPTSSQQSLMEIAASVLYQASVNPLKASGSAKRLKREGAFDRLRDGLMKGKWLWCGAFCFLIHNYGIRIEESYITNWLKGISESLERGLWELCFVLSHSASKKYSSPTSDEADAALILLGNIILENLINTPIVPQEVWELQIFKHMPSLYVSLE